MMQAHAYQPFPYVAPHDLMQPKAGRRALLVIGAGPVGLAAAIDARLQGIEVLVLDDDDTVSVGSRAVCYAKRTLEVLQRLGVGAAACAKGVSWNVGRTFCGEQEVYRFNLVPEPGHRFPGMVNLQQYHLEEMLVVRALQLGVDLRWKHRVVAVQPQADHARVTVETPDATFDLEADWVIVADGARSPVRSMLGLDIDGQVFRDRFLIADVVMQADYPAERWFWFDPPFHRGQSVLLHKQADNVWRIDFQLGWDADPEEEKKPERVIPRIKAMLGEARPFELEWVSIYTFQCRRMKAFRHGRLLFAGDAAHQVSPFGARGANSGIQDADGLVWKLKQVLDGAAPETLLDTYADERACAADENILNSTRSTDFITPKSTVSRLFRDAALSLAGEHAFARKLVNSGRLSVPTFYVDSALNTPDAESFAGNMVPGAPCDDAPVGLPASVQRCESDGIEGRGDDVAGEVAGDAGDHAQGWLLDHLGNGFQLLLFADTAAGHAGVQQALAELRPRVSLLVITSAPEIEAEVRCLQDRAGLLARRYDARSGTCYLLRPDQHVAARWRSFDAVAVKAALRRALAADRGLGPDCEGC